MKELTPADLGEPWYGLTAEQRALASAAMFRASFDDSLDQLQATNELQLRVGLRELQAANARQLRDEWEESGAPRGDAERRRELRVRVELAPGHQRSWLTCLATMAWLRGVVQPEAFGGKRPGVML